MILAAAGLFFSVLVGSCLQRISGMGVGLIAVPVLSLLIGPVEGVLVVNVIATVNALITTMTVRKDVDWAKFFAIAPYMVLGALPGALLITLVSTDALLVLVGVFLLAALSIVTLGKRYVPVVHGRVPAAVSGAIGGFLNTLAGVAGPAITVYAQAARWNQRTYSATLQPIFMVGGAVSFAVKEFTGAANIGDIEPIMWLVGGAAMMIGIFTGVKLAPHVASNTARAIALGLAVLGGVTALVRGGVGLLA